MPPKVVNRRGLTVNYSVDRIKEVLAFCSSNLDVEILELESAIGERVVSGVTTTQQIQNNAIQSALVLADKTKNRDWLVVAGRLNLWDLNKQINSERPKDCRDCFLTTLKYQVEVLNNYTNVFSYYSDTEIKNFGDFVKQLGNIDKFDYAGSQLLRERYLLRHEKPEEMFAVCALLLASKAPSGGDKVALAKEFYLALSTLKISLATPFLANLRTNNPNLSSCFILTVDDSLESITEAITEIAKISKQGGGVGVNISRIRSRGSIVAGVEGASGGVVPWIKIINDLMVAVSQVRSKRLGAATVALDVWHADIVDFLDLQTENGDLRRKAYDIFPQVAIPDAFMEAVQQDSDWHLFDPYLLSKAGIDLYNSFGDTFESRYKTAVRLVPHKTLKAKDLYKLILKTQIETGLPYLFFKDTVNSQSVNDGIIPSANLCVESYSPVSDDTTHCCNLISLNLAELLELEDWSYYCRLSVLMLNAAFSLTVTPTAKAKNHNDRLKTIGIGVMGVVDYLAYHGEDYSQNSAKKIFSEILNSVVRASSEVAEFNQQPYPNYKKENWISWLEGKIQKDTLDRVAKYGLANGQLMAIAPNTSSSLLGGCTASLLPAYDTYFTNKDGQGSLPVIARYAKEKQWHYATAKNTNSEKVIDFVSTAQVYIDQGISMELSFDLNDSTFNAKKMADTIFKAWEQGCKAIYYVRTVQKSNTSQCSSCAN
jgi:ribonucleoside-diphosphate reductase alpha chain